jgi:phosphate transport system protein
LAEPSEQPLRLAFAAELDQLRLQVEVMAVRVSEELERMRRVLLTGDRALAEVALAADDDVDAMHVSLTGRCYELIGRQAPVARDLRFLLSSLRMLEELERVGDLSLRVVNQVDDQPLLAAHPAVFATLEVMADAAQDLFRIALKAWSAQDVELACTLAEGNQVIDAHYATLVDRLLELDGPDTARVAVAAVLVGRALERIADHAVIIGERLRYLLTGDPAFIASEVR